ncbi:hypothetical protein [Zhongshania aquimaris]|uniref:Uncharacterized protein n=1 Tax=Zhongshania aquimaris TaxID=2857107 RepID=A0ABS6VPP6_9GAMM|nr:hypothetical protein [Zhongshania aquimaris]MBW2940292.1 hypothetical protein [Zhongshania aquimaris]
MHYKEIDFRSTPLRTLCTATTNVVSELIHLSKNGVMDGITAMEYAEYFYGAALVACQTYAAGTVSDINEIEKANYKKIDLYKYQETNCHEYTYVELINSLANYFKHNEEWSVWPVNETTKTLRHYHIDENTDFPLYQGIKTIIGESPDVRRLCEVLEDWRFSLLNTRRKNI